MRSAAFLFFLCLLLILPPAIQAEDEAPPEGLTAKEAKSLCSKLRSKASDWWRRRKRMVSVCGQCKGRGQVPWRKGRRRAMVDCPKCDGNKIHVDKKIYAYCFYERRSPAFRLQEGIRARLTEQYVAAKTGNPFPVILKSYSIKDSELVDATHGIVYVKQNKDSVARPQHWIWAEERGKSATWFLYDEAADGRWPSDEEEAAPEPEPQPEPEPVPEVAPEPEPEPATPPRPRTDVNRVGMEESRALLEKWMQERSNMKARLIRIRLGLDELEGHEQKEKDARGFLREIDGWIAESLPAYERALEDTVESEWGVRLDDRIKVNTRHFNAHRRLDLVENMLKFVIPGLK